MKLDRFEYISNEGLSNEWRLDECKLSQINLIVGKNARGKSRIVKAIYNISEILLSKKVRSIVTGKAVWRLYFDEAMPDDRTVYILQSNQGVVIQEKLLKGNQELLTRDESGIGEIWAEQLHIHMKLFRPLKS
ncbi:MAG: hypothetical protein Fur0025_39030 [Oscillatoriaceae cyanobacterium]